MTCLTQSQSHIEKQARAGLELWKMVAAVAAAGEEHSKKQAVLHTNEITHVETMET